MAPGATGQQDEDVDIYQHHIRNDVSYRSQQLSRPGSVSVASLVYLVVARDHKYLEQVTTTVLKQSGAEDVVCATVEGMLIADTIRKDIKDREMDTGYSSPLYVINNVNVIQTNATKYLAAMNFLHTATDGLGAAQDATFVLLWWDSHSIFSSSSLSSSSFVWQDYLRQEWSNEDPAFNVDALIGRITRVIIQPFSSSSSRLEVDEKSLFICPSSIGSFVTLTNLLNHLKYAPNCVAIVFMMLLVMMLLNLIRIGKKNVKGVDKNAQYGTSILQPERGGIQSKSTMIKASSREKKIDVNRSSSSSSSSSTSSNDMDGVDSKITAPVPRTRSQAMLQRRQRQHPRQKAVGGEGGVGVGEAMKTSKPVKSAPSTTSTAPPTGLKKKR